MARRFTLGVAVLGPLLVGACHGSSPTTPVGPTTPPLLAAAPSPDRPESATHPLSGVYDLTLTLGDDCTAVPAADRTRSYTATIAYADTGAIPRHPRRRGVPERAHLHRR